MEKEKTTTEKEHKPEKKKEVVIFIKGLKKSFGEKDVLKNINLELKRGENVVILGRLWEISNYPMHCRHVKAGCGLC
jgi:phospholipid/cholesterol/gamma-HCH transport system ATP-binding protein